MDLRRTRRWCALVLVVVALGATLTSCRTVRVGARCTPAMGFAQNGDHVLICQRGRWVRWRTKAQAAQLLLSVLQAAQKPEPGSVVPPASLGTANLPRVSDPSAFSEGGVTYVYSTRTQYRLPVRALGDVDRTYTVNEIEALTREAMPSPVPWAADDEVWAPDVVALGGRYVAYFAARRTNPPDPANPHCIGRATATSPLGPFVAEPMPIHCGNDGRGALDPEVYGAPDGRPYLLAAFGGSNTNLWSIPLDANGNVAAAATALLARIQPWEDWFLENPSMIWDGRHHVLAYSAGRWQTGAYMTGVARCATPTGPCTSIATGPWLASAGDRTGPGGLTFFAGTDGAGRVMFHTYPAGGEGNGTTRGSHVARVHFDPWPRLG